MMKDYIVKVSMSDRVKNPAGMLDRVFNGDAYLIEEFDKHIQWEEIQDSNGKVIGTNTVIDWGM
jgi:hypothetical protein